MEVKTIVCPNCGANTTNATNCEYCNSLLVRFVDKGIDLSQTSYIDNKATFPGLIEALKKNIQLQNSNNKVVTDIVGPINGRKSDYIACVLKSGNAAFMDGTKISSKSHKGLCVVFSFGFYTDPIGHKNYNKISEENFIRFGALDCFPLFNEHSCIINSGKSKKTGYVKISEEQNVTEYFIDFGEDAEGAARMLSRIFQEVYGLAIENKIEYYTNQGVAINNHRKNLERRFYAERHPKYTPTHPQNDTQHNKKDLIAWVVGIIGGGLCLWIRILGEQWGWW